VQEALVRKVATVLSPFDNVYYELIGEPYLEPVRPEWQARMISALAEIEASLGRPHLIAKNLPSVLGTGVDVEPAVSILNFHNAAPSDVRANLDAGCALGFDETVFLGTDDAPHRTGGWDFLMSGGAIFSNTDYSFTTRDPSGRHAPPALNRVPGSWSDSASMGGGPVLRSQLAFLLRFFDRLPLVEMAPAPNVIAEGPRLGSARVLARSGLVYAVYLNSLGADVHTENIRLRVETGRYVVQWFDPVTGREADEREVSTEGEISLRSPAFTDDAVVLLTRSATAT
jgi:hypothetical protein